MLQGVVAKNFPDALLKLFNGENFSKNWCCKSGPPFDARVSVFVLFKTQELS